MEMWRKKKNKFGSKNGELTKYEKDGLKKLTEIRLEIAEIRQNLWRKYRDSGQEILATVRQRRERLESEEMDKIEKRRKEKTESTRRLETDQKNDCKRKSVSITDKLNEKRKEQIEKVRTMKSNWKMIRNCVEYIEQNRMKRD